MQIHTKLHRSSHQAPLQLPPARGGGRPPSCPHSPGGGAWQGNATRLSQGGSLGSSAGCLTSCLGRCPRAGSRHHPSGDPSQGCQTHSLPRRAGPGEWAVTASGDGVSFWGSDDVLELDRGGVVTTRMCYVPLNHTLQSGSSYAACVLPQPKNKASSDFERSGHCYRGLDNRKVHSIRGPKAYN